MPAAAGGVDAVTVPEERRRLACLSDEELQRLREIGRRVERHYGRAQDIEWAVDGDTGEILLLAEPARDRLVGQGGRAGRARGRQSARPCDDDFRRSPVSLTAKDVAEIIATAR